MMKISEVRGPDGEGKYIDDNISLGHNLLAITEDAKCSEQPWTIDENRIMCYNGEIYNYEELRSELKKLGHLFETDGDTEVLAKAILQWGDDTVDKLDGMFAIALYDKRDRTLLLARDTSGTKPLYWAQDKRGISFSSSLKSILSLGYSRKLDRLGYKLYDEYGFVPGPKTLIESISKLHVGQVIKFNMEDGRQIYNKHIKFNYHQKKMETFDYAGFRSEMGDAVRRCVMGKRQVGLYLSGGMDSGMILHELSQFMDKPKTFTTRFQDSKNGKRGEFPTGGVNEDADYALKMAKKYNSEHTELFITPQMFIDAVDDCALALEEPRANKNTPAYYLLNKELARQGIVVTLSGDGGDEVLTGYLRHHKYENIPGIQTDVYPMTKGDPEIMEYTKSWFPINQFTEDNMNNQLYTETIIHLVEDFLIRNDKLGMNFSMEARFPFTTKKFREYALSIPSHFKYNENYVKQIPRIAYEGLMPHDVLYKKKSGWTVSKDFLVSDVVKQEYVKPTLCKSYYPEINPCFGDWEPHVGKRINSRFPKVMNFKVWAKNFKVTM